MFRCIEMGIVKSIHTIQLLKSNKSNIYLKRLSIALMQNFCALATLYEDHQRILRTEVRFISIASG